MTTPSVPRSGTRVRAVYDLLSRNSSERKNTKWSEAKDAYDGHHPSYNHNTFGPRRHSGMNVSRILNKYATRISRGVYIFKNGAPFIPGDKVKGVANDYYFSATQVYEIEKCEWSERDNVWYVTLKNTFKAHNERDGWFSSRFVKYVEPLVPVSIRHDEHLLVPVQKNYRQLENEISMLESMNKSKYDTIISYRNANERLDARVRDLTKSTDELTRKLELTLKLCHSNLERLRQEVIDIRDGTVWDAPSDLTKLYNELGDLITSLE